MSEIRKMYNNVGFDIVACGYDYPYFTAEKQLELIVFVISHGNYITFHNTKDFSRKTIAEGLATCINSKWQSLTEEEKAEIKRILE